MEQKHIGIPLLVRLLTDETAVEERNACRNGRTCDSTNAGVMDDALETERGQPINKLSRQALSLRTARRTWGHQLNQRIRSQYPGLVACDHVGHVIGVDRHLHITVDEMRWTGCR